MDENAYILDILNHIGLAINEKNKTEIIVNYPIKIDKKNMKFYLDKSKYEVSSYPIGTFLSDFLNTDFNSYEDFCNIFCKYGIVLFDSKKLDKDYKYNQEAVNFHRDFITQVQEKNKNKYIKLQEQVDEILDYTLFSPNKRAIKFSPTQRLYVLRRISPALTILNENKASYYSTNLFSNYPGDSEKEIYDFLNIKSNKVTEFDLIIPNDICAMLYKSICSVLKEDIHLKVCKNCGRYFIATNKSQNYCTNVAPNEYKKTCRSIGRQNVFNSSKNEDSVLNLYYKVYNRKAMMKSRNPDIDIYVKDFNKYKEAGKKKLVKYKTGKITKEELKDWIEKNK